MRDHVSDARQVARGVRRAPKPNRAEGRAEVTAILPDGALHLAGYEEPVYSLDSYVATVGDTVMVLSPDSGPTVIGRFGAGVRSGLGMVDIRDHGAVGDGVTDDTGPINEAVQKATAENASVFIPGTNDAWMTDGIPLAGTSVTLKGVGSRSVIRHRPESALNLLNFEQWEGPIRAVGVEWFSDLRLEGNGENGLNGTTVEPALINLDRSVVSSPRSPGVSFNNVVTAGNGGLAWHFKDTWGHVLQSCVSDLPVEGGITDSPVMLLEGWVNDKHFNNYMIRNSSVNSEAAPLVCIKQNDTGAYESHSNVWTGTRFEKILLKEGAAIMDLKMTIA